MPSFVGNEGVGRVLTVDVEQADAVVSEALGEPRGVVRCSCPLGLVEALSPAFVGFMKAFPKAKLQVVAVERAVGLIDERIDVAVRVRAALDTDAALTMRTLGRSSRILVAAPTLAASCTVGDVAALSELPTLAWTDQMGEIVWEFSGPDGELRSIRHEPRMTCVDFMALRDAAVTGVSVWPSCRITTAEANWRAAAWCMSSRSGARRMALSTWSSRRAVAYRRLCAPSSTIRPEPSETATSQAEATAKEGAPAIGGLLGSEPGKSPAQSQESGVASPRNYPPFGVRHSCLRSFGGGMGAHQASMLQNPEFARSVGSIPTTHTKFLNQLRRKGACPLLHGEVGSRAR